MNGDAAPPPAGGNPPLIEEVLCSEFLWVVHLGEGQGLQMHTRVFLLDSTNGPSLRFGDAPNNTVLRLRGVSPSYFTRSGTQLRIQYHEPECRGSADAVGFTILVDDIRWAFFSEDVARWMSVLQSVGCTMRDLGAQCRIESVLSSCDYWMMYSAVALKGTMGRAQSRVVIKCTSTHQWRIQAESDILFSLHHPNVIKPRGLFSVVVNGTECLAVVTDDLQQIAREKMSEAQARPVFAQLLCALKYIHACNVVHRDVKITKLLCYQYRGGSRIILSDFSLSARTDDQVAMTRLCGSPGCIAPEILQKRPYGTQVDMFAAGVLLFELVVGDAPFRRADIATTLTANTDARLPEEYLTQVSNDLLDLLRGLFEKDPNLRLNAAAGEAHAWLQHRDRSNSAALNGRLPADLLARQEVPPCREQP
jgi:serine/threonine protein kinase